MVRNFVNCSGPYHSNRQERHFDVSACHFRDLGIFLDSFWRFWASFSWPGRIFGLILTFLGVIFITSAYFWTHVVVSGCHFHDFGASLDSCCLFWVLFSWPRRIFGLMLSLLGVIFMTSAHFWLLLTFLGVIFMTSAHFWTDFNVSRRHFHNLGAFSDWF